VVFSLYVGPISLFDNPVLLNQAVHSDFTITPTLDGLLVFVAVAELQGFRVAARRLGITPSAVSQSVRSLERRVGVPLFTRTTRSVRLTEAGEQLLAYARPGIDMLAAGVMAAGHAADPLRGRLRINAPRAALPLLVNRLLPDFLVAYPALQLELVGDDRLVDIVADRFDAGIRLGAAVQVDMVATWLTPPERFVVVGAPRLLKAHGIPGKPKDLQRFPCILYRPDARGIEHWPFRTRGRALTVDVRGPLAINDADACLRAALRGVGVFRVPRSIVMSYVAAGSLVVVLDSHGEDIAGLSLYYPVQSQALPRLRAFIDFATKRMRRPFENGDYLPSTR
jgi:DNA-binding transcriptional LysR family regulator